MPPRLIVLDVSGRKYQTQEVTLQSSPYFKSFLARWEDGSDRQEDGSYFVDANAEVFQYILDFMRRPSKFPLFWTKETGFDYALYNRLEAEADYFLLHGLRDWLREKRYLDAVKTVVEIKTLSGHQLYNFSPRTEYKTNVEVQSFFGSYSGERRYRRPCEYHLGHNDPVKGCPLCETLIRTHEPHYDDAPKTLTIVTKRLEFDESVCVNKTVS